MSGANRAVRRRRAARFRQAPAIPPERLEGAPCAPCGKRSWLTHEAAKRATRTTPTFDAKSALHAYRCPADPRVWHVGHMGTDKSRSYYRAKAEQA